MVASNSNFMSITLVDSDPVEAAATLNTWLTEFDKHRALAQATERLGVLQAARGSAQYAREALRDAELKLEGFRTADHHHAVGGDDDHAGLPGNA